MQLEIKNWEKYNPRNDRTNHVWFRFQNNFFFSDDVFDLDNLSKLVFVYLLCESSKKGSAQIVISVSKVCAALKTSDKEFNQLIQNLVNFGVIRRAEANQKPALCHDLVSLQTDKQTDITPPQPKVAVSNKPVFSFEDVYNHYPRKEGRKAGEKVFKRDIKTEDDYSNLLLAVKNYSALVTGRDKQYIKQFSTFMNNWRDYLEKVDSADDEWMKKAKAAGLQFGDGWVT